MKLVSETVHQDC